MAWTRPAFIFKPSGALPWSRTHAQVPTALVLDDRIRVFYATRDEAGRSRTGLVDLSRDDPREVLHVHREPVMDLGRLGTHDEDGVMVGSVIADGHRLLMYYTGWSRGTTVPYRVSVGLAESRDGGISFTRVFEGPVVDRTAREPFMTMSPYVLRDGDGAWRMWYGSGIGWVEIEGHPEPLYIVKHARSADGLSWIQSDETCIAQAHGLEANTRPSVMPTRDGFEMWFSYRHSRDFRNGSGSYRIGHAMQHGEAAWHRDDEPEGLDRFEGEGWDGRMRAYPNVVAIGGQRLMFLNGDGFGRSGFGFSRWQGA